MTATKDAMALELMSCLIRQDNHALMGGRHLTRLAPVVSPCGTTLSRCLTDRGGDGRSDELKLVVQGFGEPMSRAG
jgi:hypothetical protein